MATAAAAVAVNTTGATTSGSGELPRTPSMMEVRRSRCGGEGATGRIRRCILFHRNNFRFSGEWRKNEIYNNHQLLGVYDPTNVTEQQQRRMPGIARERFLADAANANANTTPTNNTRSNANFPTIEPLWVIIQTVELAGASTDCKRPGTGLAPGAGYFERLDGFAARKLLEGNWRSSRRCWRDHARRDI